MKRYRYVDHLYTSGVKVELVEFDVLRLTPAGAWVSRGPLSKPSWVANGGGKRLCHETKEWAAASFIARKKRQIRIYQTRLGNAQDALALIKSGDLSREWNVFHPARAIPAPQP